MGKLVVDEVVQIDGDHVLCVHCTFDIESIINSGYAPDDVIDYVLKQCVETHIARQKLKDVDLDVD